ncbi:hypothetical protein FGO68_gene9195 [Halteria grandinella]|uniref:Uncharacterized protein n=1 Tax=Halteria grandinella TaxID=5974 RepID=A0A8J8NVR2_HALGN|nr:hypothetical protein FGO68_gene9195 [Halteria grandinella]
MKRKSMCNIKGFEECKEGTIDEIVFSSGSAQLDHEIQYTEDSQIYELDSNDDQEDNAASESLNNLLHPSLLQNSPNYSLVHQQNSSEQMFFNSAAPIQHRTERKMLCDSSQVESGIKSNIKRRQRKDIEGSQTRRTENGTPAKRVKIKPKVSLALGKQNDKFTQLIGECAPSIHIAKKQTKRVRLSAPTGIPPQNLPEQGLPCAATQFQGPQQVLGITDQSETQYIYKQSVIQDCNFRLSEDFDQHKNTETVLPRQLSSNAECHQQQNYSELPRFEGYTLELPCISEQVLAQFCGTQETNLGQHQWMPTLNPMLQSHNQASASDLFEDNYYKPNMYLL